MTKDLFLALTQFTCPSGTEEHIMKFMPKEFVRSKIGNFIYLNEDSDVLLTAHLDDVSNAITRVNHVIDGRFIRTDGKSILGADDKAGVTVLLSLFEKKCPYNYAFFIGEEGGAIGSRDFLLPSYINKVISFDRKYYNNIITSQTGGRCCSDKFADDMANEYADKGKMFFEKQRGIFTDSATFMEFASECTNLSVGCFDSHQYTEFQDIAFLDYFIEVTSRIDFNSLKTYRKLADEIIEVDSFDFLFAQKLFNMDYSCKITTIPDAVYKRPHNFTSYQVILINKIIKSIYVNGYCELVKKTYRNNTLWDYGIHNNYNGYGIYQKPLPNDECANKKKCKEEKEEDKEEVDMYDAEDIMLAEHPDSYWGVPCEYYDRDIENAIIAIIDNGDNDLYENGVFDISLLDDSVANYIQTWTNYADDDMRY